MEVYEIWVFLRPAGASYLEDGRGEVELSIDIHVKGRP